MERNKFHTIKLNIDRLEKLLVEEFNSSQNQMAIALGVDRGQLNKILSVGNSYGRIFYEGLQIYCKNKRINLEEFFIFA